VAALVRDPHRTEDVVAQTFLLAWRDLPKLRRADRFDSWLARIAHNQAMSELRRRPTAPLGEAPDPENPNDLDRPDTALELSSNIEAVHAALIELPDDQRQVLMLRFIRDLPHTETARLLGRSEQATRALQYRALRAMQRLIDRDDLTR
jgi:RNA polymerase sigma-70 factor, ECF subfamily